jgi:hypothetical protein
MSDPAATAPAAAPPRTGLIARRAASRPGRRAHWRARTGGAALSALLHVGVLALFVFALPQMSRAKPEAEKEIPVEVVRPLEEKKAEEKKAEVEKPKPEEPPKAAEKPPEPAKPEPAKPAPPAAAPPKAEPPKAEAPPAAEPPKAEAPKPEPPPAAEPPAPQPPRAAEAPPPVPPQAAEIPKSPAPEASAGGRPADPNEVALADEKDVIAYWDLKPIEIGPSPTCGRIRVEGQIRLIARSGKTGFVGTMRVLHVPSLCKAEAKVYGIGMLIDGSKVTLLGQDFGDTGVIDGDTMYLRDRYGISTWTRREPRRR